MIGAIRAIAGNRHLVRLFAGEAISGIGDWMYLVALLVVVYRETSDPLLLGLVGGARVIPYVVLSVPAGVVIDRYDRRVILIATDLLRGAAMIGLAIVTFGNGPIALTIGLAIVATCFAVFFRPSIGAYLPSLVRDETELGPANSVFATIGEITFIVGPAIAGVIVAASDLGLAFLLNALTFLAPVIALWGLPANDPRAAKPAAGAGAGTQEAAGAAAAGPSDASASSGASASSNTAAAAPERSFREAFMAILRPVVGMGVLDAVAGFLWGGLSVALVIFATEHLRVGEDAVGYLWAAVGVGGVVGAVASSPIVLRPNLAPALLVGSAILAAGFVLLGLAGSLPVALGAMVVAATGALVAEVVNTTVLQRVIPDAIRGRTLGLMQTSSTLAYAAGSFLVPVLMTTIGAGVLLPIGGGAILAAAAVTTVLVGAHFRRSPMVEAAADSLARVARLPLFAGVPAAALEVALQRLQPLDVGAGTVVIREGDAADRFYIIGSGQFAVDQVDPGTGVARRLRVMGPGEPFGELGLMHNAPRSATVTAETDGTLYALDGPDFLALVNAGPELSGRMLDRYRASAAPPS
jgi:MFS family permease